MSSSFSSLSSSIIARQIARVSRPRPWIVPAPVVKPAPAVCSTAVPSSTFSSLPQSAIVRVAHQVCRSHTLSTASSFASSKRSIVGGRQTPVPESGLRQTTLAARAATRTSRDRPWLNPRAGSIAAKVVKSSSTTAKWIKSQAVDLPQAPLQPPPASRDRPLLNPRAGSIAVKVTKSKSTTARWIKSQAVDLPQAPRRPSPASRQPSSTTVRHSPTSNTSTAVPAPPIVLPKRRTATPGPRQAVRYPATSNNRPALPSSSSSSSSPSRCPQEVAPPASPDNTIAAMVREAFAFDINQFRAEWKQSFESLEANQRWIRSEFARLKRKQVTFDDNPTVIENPRWIDKKEHVHPGPPRMMGNILGWRALSDSQPYEHEVFWGSDCSNFDHSDCNNPECHRRSKDLYMQEYEEWTAPTFTTISE